jgi:hypothetical protein
VVNAQTGKPKHAGLELLRQPFPAHQVSKLPKPTKAQTEAVRDDFKKGIRCKVCGLWHHPDVVHLDYVGHAALTDRLLDCDPHWNWEPVSPSPEGMPMLDKNMGMWIRLTVCGVTRLGYGHAEGKQGGDAIKEVIGDALRNAAMRFGAALDLWHKGDLHLDDETPEQAPANRTPPRDERRPPAHRPDPSHKGPSPADIAIASLGKADTLAQLAAIWCDLPVSVKALPEVVGAKDNRKAELQQPAADLAGDTIPY